MKKIYLPKLAMLVALLAGFVFSAKAQTTTTYLYTAAVQTYTVPLFGVTSINVDMAGASGGVPYYSSYGTSGNGGRVTCVLAVTPGQVLSIYVGQKGGNGNSSCCGTVAGGYNGGGAGEGYGAGAGGASDIRTGAAGLSQRIVVAGGGGGCGWGYGTCSGGAGGGLTAGNGSCGCSYYEGSGATQTAGGNGNDGNSGTFGNGGNGAFDYCGGGGGGWYGGGGGYIEGGGGGGSSYTSPTLCSSVVHTQGYIANGNGYVAITPNCVTPIAGTITGPTVACAGGAPITLSDPTSSGGGIWSSSNTAVATVGSLTGVVTGVSSGAAIMTYTINVSPSPAPITGTTNICSANPVTLSSLTPGGTWSSSNTLFATVGSISGVVTGVNTGFPTITYTLPTTCAATISTTVNVSPNIYTVTGGGAYCSGSAVPHVILSNSDALVNYSLYNGTTLVSTVAGIGRLLDFGAQPANGVYTVTAVNTNGGCTQTMAGSVTVTANTPPVAYNLTPGGATSFCNGSAGVSIGLNNSNSGVSYQLLLGTGVISAPVIGTGAAFNFPVPATLSGVYTVLGTSLASGCTTAMSGSETVTVNPIPNIYTVTGGGNYCTGGSGLPIGLSGSDLGVTYRLYDGSTLVDTILSETSGLLSFGNMTTNGTYTVVAINPTTLCSSNMDGSATIGVIALPASYPITGGGSYCSGGAGKDIGLSYSVPGIRYQLYNGSTAVGTYKIGTGAPLDYGYDTARGTYTIIATNPLTTCSATMGGTAVISVNTLPNVYNVTGTNSYCAGGTGVNVGLSGSDAGITYNLYDNSSIFAGSVASGGGTFNFGLQTRAGNYTVIASNNTTGCVSNMVGSAVVTINPLPASYPVTGGGNYCAGGSGVAVVLNGSTSGISYQAEVGGVLTGTAMNGTGGTLTFNSETTSGAYTILATNTLTHCSAIMSGSVTVTVNPSPTPYDVTGGGTYCAGGSGFHVGLGYSNTGVNYQLYNGTTMSGTPVSGTGGAIDFGIESTAGNYTVVATNGINHCSATMPGSATINIIPLPTAYTVTGGGNYCSGGAGVPFGLSGSTIGINYLLYNGATLMDSIAGNGIPISFGLQTMPGSYSVVAVNPTSNCTSNMIGGGTGAINPLPSVYTVSGGGAYCANGTGVNVYLGNSSTGVSYQLQNGSLPTGTAINGTGSGLNFGLQTAAGPYTVLATNTTTGCTATMTGGATVTVNPLPTAYTVTGGGGFCAGGSGVHVGLSGSNVGMSYQLNDGAPVGSAVSVSGGAIDFGLLTAAGTYSVIATNAVTGCSNVMDGSVAVTINPLPAVYTVTGGGSYCADGAGVPVGLNSSNTGIGYQLYNGTTTVGTPWMGTGSSLSFGLIGVPGTYTVMAIDQTTMCTSNMSLSATVTMNPLVTPAISVTSGSGYTVCAGTPVTFSATSVNGGSSPAYQWSVNGRTVSGAISTGYGYSPANGDRITATITSSNVCARPASATSAPVTMLVNPVGTPNISITANTGNTVCNGTNVVFSATPVYGGLTPVYTWKRNGIPVGTDSAYYAVTPNNNDNISVTMNTSYPCATLPVAYSNQIDMNVDTAQTPIVTITANPGTTVTAGQTVTFGATVNYSGSGLTYQWMMNNAAIPGATASTYTGSNFSTGDKVACMVTNENVCGTQSGTGAVTMSVGNLGASQLGNGGTNISLVPNPNKGAFTLQGTLATSGNEEVSVSITNMLGQVVYSGKIIPQNGKIDEHIQVNGALANGMYLLNLNSETENTVIHFAIEQ